MKKLTKDDLRREARSLRQYVTDPQLVGWLWPWQHARAVKLIQDVDKPWYQRNAARILPAEPVRRVEMLRAALESELLV